MEKKCILINAVHPEESRVAIADRGYLQELEVEAAEKVQVKSNIYKGIITRVEPSLQAAFVEYGSAKQGFLPLNEIHSDYWRDGKHADADVRKAHIQDVIEGRQHILVQVVKEERGNKGAALTTFISLAGRYLVLSPNTARAGISRKLNDEDRRTVKQLIEHLDVPPNMGIIVRTAGKDQELESLQRDFSYLLRLWEEIRIKADGAKVPSFIYLDGDLATRTIRDHFSDDIEEIWVDQYELYQRTKQFVHAVLPGKEKIVKLYRDKVPLFTKFGIEEQCAEIYAREINMKSGAQLVFDPTEALTSIDINSGRSTSAKHIDETALETNLESAREIARQLRIRDIGGLIVIDFIDMSSRKHAQLVEEELRKACKGDKARIQFARISRFGLLEMSRQRLHLSIRESTSEVCPRCQGLGSIRTVESIALHLLNRIDDEAKCLREGDTLTIQMAAEAVDYLSNHKRQSLLHIEDVYKIPVYLQTRTEIHHPHYRIERQWQDDSGQARIEVLEDTAKGKKVIRSRRKLKQNQKPVVGVPTAEDATPKKEEVKTWWALLLDRLFGSPVTAMEEVKPKKTKVIERRQNKKPAVAVKKEQAKQEKKEQPKEEKKEKSSEGEVEGTPSRRRRRRRRSPRKDESGVNTPQADTINSDQNTTQDKPKQDKPTQDKPTQDKPTQDKPKQDKPKQDKPKQDKPTQDKPTQDKPTQDKPTQDKPKQDKPKQDKPKQDKPKQDKPKQDKPKQDKPKQDKPKQDKPSMLVDNHVVNDKTVKSIEV
ncbi:MAG: Rne/Rng family ribonuclease [Mariprofundaceae bacterium]|nr:Rne/Rng family ribonuclease [Mariprofundaceae bacterium]